MKKKVNDTLTFLHKERNDFLPQDDIIIPSRKDDHVSKEINLSNENIKKKRIINFQSTPEISQEDNNVRFVAENEIDDVIKQAENVVNNIQSRPTELPLNSVKNDSNQSNAVEIKQVKSNKKRGSKKNNKNDSPKQEKREETETVGICEMRRIGKDGPIVCEERQVTVPKKDSVKNGNVNFQINRDSEFIKPTSQMVETIICEMRQIGQDGSIVCEERRVKIPYNQNAEEDNNKDDPVLKAQEVFQFLEDEASSPISPTKTDFSNSAQFIQNEIQYFNDLESEDKSSNKSSAIPIAKPRQKLPENKGEKDVDAGLLEGENNISPSDDFLSKIPVSGKGKVKTIKKHSKDPLKEFVKLTQDVNWDNTDGTVTTVKTVTTDPIVKTTVTRITSESGSIPEFIKNKTATTEYTEISPKSKIPVLVTETTRILSPETTQVERTVVSPTSTQVIETTLISPGSETKYSLKSSTMDSDSDSDSRRSPALKGILKKSTIRTVGSSSGSDVALHEAGSELSEDESGNVATLNSVL